MQETDLAVLHKVAPAERQHGASGDRKRDLDKEGMFPDTFELLDILSFLAK